MNIKPLADRILVEPLEAMEKTSGGIVIPDTAKEKPQEGRVVAVGPGKMANDGILIKMEISPGDTILYGKYSGTEITMDDKALLFMRESDALAVL